LKPRAGRGRRRRSRNASRPVAQAGAGQDRCDPALDSGARVRRAGDVPRPQPRSATC
jgi:hypothetical protein